ncbi:MAG: class I SAM-dependent methyltransferase [Rhodospirillaceae bacterium]|nr:class I SAM-dependent methyltransferase [Rhodospirillaceae bacterium]
MTGPDEIEALRSRLDWEKFMRRTRMRDSVEIEILLRRGALPSLPPRPGREHQLTDLIGTSVAEGLYIVDALAKSLAVEGAVCEFGVAQGATSQLLAAEILATDRHLYLFDSFEGLPAPSAEDVLLDDIFALGSIDRYAGTMRCAETEVCEKLAAIAFPPARCHIMKGWLEETLRRPDAPARIAFAYVDLDFFAPIAAALDFLDRRTAPGARIVVDDYGFFSAGAQRATDAFVAGTGGRWRLDKPLDGLGHFVTLTRLAGP